ncbi:protein COBRA-like [Senna tora]|uniref:Protein COBRA-like n=1 Tax=Senna tora TaxID=362788 RepID=A0A834WGZ8_9FABA|nr:protein COBRA-like [Senna tora]
MGFQFIPTTIAFFPKRTSFVLFLFILMSSTSSEAYDPIDPNGNITIKWDVMSWTPDGYVAVVTINNFQQYRHIPAPGWSLGWTWAKKEVIWSMMGGQTTEQGDCSKFKGNIPHCCKKDPTVVDMLPGTPYNQQIANCCKGGVLSSWVQDPPNAVAAFQVSVGRAGTTNKTVKVPKNFTLKAPGPGYTCGPAKIVKPTQFIQPDKRRVTQALMTWNVTCTYSQFLAQKTPTCCVSLSSFYNDTIVPCPTCACGCQGNSSQSGGCVEEDSPHIQSVVSGFGKNSFTPLVQCTRHMCPIRVHWHVKINYKEYWRVKITITNFNYRMNYSDWNLVIQHPNFDNLTQLFSFNYKSLTPYGTINDTAMLWGIKFYNDLLTQAGPYGNVQSELLFRKDKSSFTFNKGWAFPRRIYFNGDNCVMPPPDAYPWLPNSGSRQEISLLALLMGFLNSNLKFDASSILQLQFKTSSGFPSFVTQYQSLLGLNLLLWWKHTFISIEVDLVRECPPLLEGEEDSGRNDLSRATSVAWSRSQESEVLRELDSLIGAVCVLLVVGYTRQQVHHCGCLLAAVRHTALKLRTVPLLCCLSSHH